MAVIINIESSTEVCSVALSKDGIILFKKVDYNGPSHSTLLPQFIKELVDFAKNSSNKIDAVAVSGGPGSYTGLRIGVSSAKGLCFGYNVPLIEVDTLSIMSVAATEKIGADDSAKYIPMIDARRMEIYQAKFNSKIEKLSDVEPLIVDATSYESENQKFYIFGNGAKKCSEVIENKNMVYIDGIVPLAENMITLAEQKYSKKEFVDLAYYEPFYLKSFVPTTPKSVF